MLDYYLKYLKMYVKHPVRIVAPWPSSQIPGSDLLQKFTDMGVHLLAPENVASDYNAWAAENQFRFWNQLTPGEQAALVDDFWEFDFFDGEILGFAPAIARIQQEWEDAGNSPQFVLTDADRQWIQNCLDLLGVPQGAWYVCLHVREPGFHQQWNSLYPSMRDANIDDYHLVIEKIVNAGGWVLRMGDPSMKALPPMRNVIDYAHSPFKTTRADIFLAASCRFLIGTNSGFANLCSMYNVPCALTNWVPIGWPLWLRQDLVVPKLFRDKNTGAYLNLEQVLESGIAYIQNWSELPANLELVANTAEELAQVTMEMLTKSGVDCGLAPPSGNIYARAMKAYEVVARRYGSYTGSQLSRTFVEKHPEVFQFEIEAQENDKLRLLA
jgi:putative glycosyltransferase (TIGR04372 family)